MNIFAEQSEMSKELLEWCAEMRDLWAAHFAPIESMDDERAEHLVQLLTESHGSRARRWVEHEVERFAPLAGAKYFDLAYEKPLPPLPHPTWATELRMGVTSWPEMEVEFAPPQISIGDATLVLSKNYLLAVDAREGGTADLDDGMYISAAETALSVELDGENFDASAVDLEKAQTLANAFSAAATMIKEASDE